MTEPKTFHQYLFGILGSYLLPGLLTMLVLSASISLLFAKKETSDELKSLSTSVAYAFHDRILDGDVRSVEPQLKKLFQLRGDDNAQIVRYDGSRTYNSFSDFGPVIKCPMEREPCFEHYFGKARIFVPISESVISGKNDGLFLYVSKTIEFNWTYFTTTFFAFTLVFATLILMFLQISKKASFAIGSEIDYWANQVQLNPKDVRSLNALPFTELIPLKKSLEGLNRQIEVFENIATEKERHLLLRGIAHDLLSPLSRLQLYVDVLKKHINSEEYSGSFLDVSDALKDVISIASQIKTLDDNNEDTSGNSDLAKVVTDSVQGLKKSKLISEKLISLNLICDLNSAIVPLSSTNIIRILGNLVDNAAHASETNGEITVEVSLSSGSYYVSVTDHGRGIEEYHKSKIYDADFTSNPGLGTGIGLTVVKDICDKHNVDISFESTLNIGTKFTLKLPTEERYHA